MSKFHHLLADGKLYRLSTDASLFEDIGNRFLRGPGDIDRAKLEMPLPVSVRVSLLYFYYQHIRRFEYSFDNEESKMILENLSGITFLNSIIFGIILDRVGHTSIYLEDLNAYTIVAAAIMLVLTTLMFSIGTSIYRAYYIISFTLEKIRFRVNTLQVVRKMRARILRIWQSSILQLILITVYLFLDPYDYVSDVPDPDKDEIVVLSSLGMATVTFSIVYVTLNRFDDQLTDFEHIKSWFTKTYHVKDKSFDKDELDNDLDDPFHFGDLINAHDERREAEIEIRYDKRTGRVLVYLNESVFDHHHLDMNNNIDGVGDDIDIIQQYLRAKNSKVSIGDRNYARKYQYKIDIPNETEFIKLILLCEYDD
eukprot:CAMPEP_0184007262 /NCGR_PEP_ID=MMETSP0954-20121128/1215_1 /TAXON_ID=627963 /ORGANISM="Aplanochytrium sp, Strain PBS07" /LENGTH=366 /DNA_ID=CAMNT_0026286031 /DNA_START=274 /DNA_END=1375 /DNA_ORIENTATION=-